jgi:hypothetical protein
MTWSGRGAAPGRLAGQVARQEKQAEPLLQSTFGPHLIELPWLHQGERLFNGWE